MSEWQGKTVLVTGGSGFLGSHLVSALSNKGAVAISVSRGLLAMDSSDNGVRISGASRSFQVDLRDGSEIDALCKYIEPRIDVLIHCAALDGNAVYKTRHPAEIVTNNIQMALSVLEAARSNGIRDVVLVSSTEIYASEAQNPIHEFNDFTTIFPFPSDGYVRSKVIIEILGQVYAEQYGLRIYVPRPANIYGPGDHVGAERGRVIPSMLAKILSGETVTVWGDGRQSRTFIYVEDAVRAILLMVEKRRVGPLNIATKEATTIEELAKYLFELIGRPQKIVFDRSMPSGKRDRLLDVRSLYEILDFEPCSLTEGLIETIHWYMNSREIMDL